MPDCEITVSVSQADIDSGISNILDLKVRRDFWNEQPLHISVILMLLNICLYPFLRLAKVFNKKIKFPYEEYDVIIVNNVDSFNDLAYSPLLVIRNLLWLFLQWLVFRRPIATVPTDVGPFLSRRNQGLARFTLNKVNVLVLRDKVSYDNSLQLNLKKPKIYFTCDGVFLLETAPKQKVEFILKREGVVRDNHPFIGFVPCWPGMDYINFPKSLSMEERRVKYIALLADLTDYTVEKLNSILIFIPYVTVPGSDDRELSYLISEKIRNKKLVTILKNDYSPDEVKGIIGECDMFISVRMHPTIGSTSLGIPTLAIAYYANKFQRVVGEQMGSSEYIVDIRNREPEELLAELKSKVDALWENRNEVRKELTEKSKGVQEQAMLYGKIIKELVEAKRTGTRFFPR